MWALLLGFYDATGAAGLSGLGNVASVAFADLDGDGDLDLVMGSAENNGIRIMRNNAGRFQDITREVLPGHLPAILGLTVWDMDYDGIPEIIGANAHIGSRLIYLKFQNGSYSDISGKLGFTGNRSTRRVLVMDANCDDVPDLIEINTSLINEPGHRLWVRTDRGFVDETPADLQQMAGDGFSGTVCDVNNDGFPDLILSQKDMGTAVMKGAGDGSLSRLFDPIQGEHTGIAAGDWDGNGFVDLFVCTSAGGMLLANNKGHFTEATSEAGLSGLPGLRDASFADVDNDGDPDLVLLDNSGRILLMCNERGVFVDRSESQGITGRGFKTFALGDYDSDGDLDLLLAGANGLKLLENTCSGPGSNLILNNSLPGDRITVFRGDTGWCWQAGFSTNSLSQGADGISLGQSADSVVIDWVCLNQRRRISYPGGGKTIVISAPRQAQQSTKEALADTSLKIVPNPAFGSAGLVYIVERSAKVELRIVEPSGKTVKLLENAVKSPGTYWVFWDGRDEAGRLMPRGVYFVNLSLDGLNCRKKLVWLPGG